MSASGTARAGCLAILTGLAGCSQEPTVGSLEVTTATAGPDQANAYRLLVDSAAARAVEANGTVLITALPIGTHRIALLDSGANCTVAGDNPRDVVIQESATSTLTFDVSCVGGGALLVSAATSGADRDDGYVVLVDGQPAGTVAANGSATVPAVPSGQRTVALDSVAPNCSVAGDNPRILSTSIGVVTPASFEVHCTGLGTLEVTAHTAGFDLDANGYRVIVDDQPLGTIGANATAIFPGIATGSRTVTLGGIARNCSAGGAGTVTVSVGATSPTSVGLDLNCHSAPILFAREGAGTQGIYVVNADGTGERRLTYHPDLSPVWDIQPRWSPDGTKIVFASNRDGNWEVYVMNADGSQITNLTADGANDQLPAWSPDGNSIAFQSDRSGQDRIYTMRPDGGGVHQLTDGTFDWAPAWSPDGNRMAFVRFDSYGGGLYLLDVAAGQARRLSPTAWLVTGRPAWSPEGTTIAFSSDGGGRWFKVFVTAADGGSPQRLTPEESASFDPTWSPDGTKLAFVTIRDGFHAIYLMTADGSDQRAVSATPAGVYPAWRW